ncbi:restriction endonuclease [Bacillaceae bacterium S4-13-58]
METLFMNREEMSNELKMSYSGLSKRVPMEFFSMKIPGGANSKLYSKLALIHYQLEKTLATSSRMTSVSAKAVLGKRKDEYKRTYNQVSAEIDGCLRNFPKVDPIIEAYSIVELKLLFISLNISFILFPRKNEIRFLEEIDIDLYLKEMKRYVNDLMNDIETIKDYFGELEAGDIFCQMNTDPMLDNLKSKIFLTSSRDPNETSYNELELIKRIDSIHHNGLPILIADILKRDERFSDVKVTDGSGDKGIDVDAFMGSQRFIVQCKKYLSKINSKEIRDFSLLSKELDAVGWYVATGGFSKNADQGIFPFESIEGQDIKRIADVQLIDKLRLASLVFEHKLGMKLDGTLDEQYWFNLRNPHNRMK